MKLLQSTLGNIIYLKDNTGWNLQVGQEVPEKPLLNIELKKEAGTPRNNTQKQSGS